MCVKTNRCMSPGLFLECLYLNRRSFPCASWMDKKRGNTFAYVATFNFISNQEDVIQHTATSMQHSSFISNQEDVIQHTATSMQHSSQAAPILWLVRG